MKLSPQQGHFGDLGGEVESEDWKLELNVHRVVTPTGLFSSAATSFNFAGDTFTSWDVRTRGTWLIEDINGDALPDLIGLGTEHFGDPVFQLPDEGPTSVEILFGNASGFEPVQQIPLDQGIAY